MRHALSRAAQGIPQAEAHVTDPNEEFTVSNDGDSRASPSVASLACRPPVQAVSLHVRTSNRPLELL
jgi:hypothetical protein